MFRSTTEIIDRVSSVPAFRIPFLKSRLKDRVSRLSFVFPHPPDKCYFCALKQALNIFSHIFSTSQITLISDATKPKSLTVTNCRDQNAVELLTVSLSPVTLLPLWNAKAEGGEHNTSRHVIYVLEKVSVQYTRNRVTQHVD